MNFTPDFLLTDDPQLLSSLFKYLFKIASLHYSHLGRGVLTLTLDEKLARHILQTPSLSWTSLQPLIDQNLNYFCLDWETHRQQLPSHLRSSEQALELLQSVHQLMVKSPLIHNYRPQIQAVLALSVEQAFIDLFEPDSLPEFLQEGIFFNTISRHGLVPTSSGN